jgi:type VI secretion system protein ImpK
VSKAEFDAARDTADLAQQQAADLARRLAEERAQREANEARIRDMEARISEMDRPPAGAVAQPDLTSGPQITAIDKLLDDLRARSDADVQREGDLVIVRMTNGFKPGSDLLKKDVQLITTLNATADALTRHPGATVSVVGHTDSDPIKKSGWESNDALSLARAQRVAQVLSDNGVDKNRISIDGQGFRSPLIANERGPSDKARNRRVEIMIRM